MQNAARAACVIGNYSLPADPRAKRKIQKQKNRGIPDPRAALTSKLMLLSQNGSDGYSSTSLVRASVVRGPSVVRGFQWLHFSSH